MLTLVEGGYQRGWPGFAALRTAELAGGAKAVVSAASGDEAVRIIVGRSQAKYVDTAGYLWTGGRYVTGGTPFDRSDRRIFRTQDQEMYQSGLEGNIRVDAPVKPGTYELRLHFAETRFGYTPLDGAEALRRFDVSLNGKPLLQDFDIARDAGASNTATVKVFKAVSPGPDGYVHLALFERSGIPLLNAVKLLPGAPDKPLPIRLVCGRHPVYDKQGRFWQPDTYFFSGRLVS